MIDYSQSAIPKGKTKAELKAKRDALRMKVDRAESARVKERSCGRCEVVWLVKSRQIRCPFTAAHVHHLIFGRGKRGRGKSVLSEHKLHVCSGCHCAIHEHRLRRVGGLVPLWTDYYEVVK